MNVDLPAPLSPSTHVTSPSRTAQVTSRRAVTRPKLLVIARTSSTGVVVAWSGGAVRAGFSLMRSPSSLAS